VNKLEQEAKEFLKNKKDVDKDKILADIKATTALLESCRIKLQEVYNLLIRL
tara:strand:- start:325 stop:480 length:156 start_codon:yes stop_codon:yes gene_type:complete